MNPRNDVTFCPLCYSEHSGRCPTPDEILAAGEALRRDWRQERLDKAEGRKAVEVMMGGGTVRSAKGAREA